MKKLCLALLPLFAYAHFGVILPSHAIVTDNKDSKITLTYSFMHPFAQTYMKAEQPDFIGVLDQNGKVKDITKSFSKKGESWIGSYTLKEPSVFQFFVKPKPYFEPSEGKFIKHLSKTIVDGFEAGEGWDTPIGLKAEMIPLTRPYGLYEGNVFSAKVLFNGKPASGVSVEVELYNDKHYKSKSEFHGTQVVKTDSNGVFHFSFPVGGWWGFSALLEDDKKLPLDGKMYPVELGAVLWLYVDYWK